MRILLKVSAVLALGYLVLCAAVAIRQRSLLYYPQAPVPHGPADAITLNVEGAQLEVLVSSPGAADAVIYFAGNAENASHARPALLAAFPDRALYLLNYRGFGASTGEPSEAALRSDAEALFDYVRQRHARIILVGRSLGSGVAIGLARRDEVQRLILITPYDSVERLARAKFWFLPVHWLIRDRFESWRYAPAVHVPTLVLAAEHDDVVPRANTLRLMDSFPPGVAKMVVVSDVNHHTIADSPRYSDLLGGA